MDFSVLVSPEPNKILLEKRTLPEEKFTENSVLMKIAYSAISTGTESAWLSGNANNAGNTFPYHPGYSSAGIIEKVGKSVTSFAPGDRVMAWNVGHLSHIILSEETAKMRLHKIQEENVSLKEAAYGYISSFPMLGIRKLQIEMGESVMIAGLGILGQLAVQFARLRGAYPVLACDMDPARRALALKMGADMVFDPSAPDFIEQVIKATNGKKVNAVVEVTGKAVALRQALKYTARMGRIVLTGCTRVPEGVIDFYRDVHLTGISIIGAHTSTRPSVDSRTGAWTHLDDLRTWSNFLSSKRVDMASLITKTVSPKDAQEIYTMLLTTQNPPLGLVFDWSTL
ncbi:MAG: zinc-binding alcohol dehydrogenase [Lentisphaeria bacterium]|nr:zinc-binding alcohol dehydrogenase [Lentisphaeria bacterium]